jgi:hypothetical protein
MTKMVTINQHKYEFKFELYNGKAVNGRFKGSDGPNLLNDLIAQYGKDATLHDVVQKLCASIQLYHVVINETSSIDYLYEVYGLDEDDAKDAAMTGNGECINEHEIDTDIQCVECVLVEEEETEDDD